MRDASKFNFKITQRKAKPFKSRKICVNFIKTTGIRARQGKQAVLREHTTKYVTGKTVKFDKVLRRIYVVLLYRYAFGEVAGFIHVITLCNTKIVCVKLQRNNRKACRKVYVGARNSEYVFTIFGKFYPLGSNCRELGFSA